MRGASGALLLLIWILAARHAGHGGSGLAPALALAALGALILLPAFGSPHASARMFAALALLAWLLLLVLLTEAGLDTLLLSLPPVLLPLLLATVFARTLQAGREPLITRFVRLTEGVEQASRPDVRRYTRRLTAAWVGLLVALTLTAAVLAALRVPEGWLVLAGIHPPIAAPMAVWSAWVNGWAYAVPPLAIAGELALRRWLLPDGPPMRPLHFIYQLARHWRELRAP